MDPTSQLHILVIDDDAAIRDMLRFGLHTEHFTVETVGTSAEGVSLLEKKDFDCVILDNILPDMSGVETCHLLHAKHIETPIIGLSIKTHASQKVAFLNAGADDYMEKPFSFAELIARIYAVTRRHASEPSMQETILSYNNLFTLNTETGALSNETLTTYLTPKETQLLAYLLHHSGIIVTRHMLLEYVWNMSTDPFSNSIESHISNLRKKLIPYTGEKDPVIKTVSGRGYIVE